MAKSGSGWLSDVTIGNWARSDQIGGSSAWQIPKPPLPEQQKIAAILSTWDRAIELTGKLIAAKQQRKAALMQQLLTGRVQLPGFGASPVNSGSLVASVPAAVWRGIYPPSVQPGIPKIAFRPNGWVETTMEKLLQVQKRPVELQVGKVYQLVVARRNRGGIAQKDKKIEDLTRKISELEQVAARGAPGDIGEAAESTLEEDLRREFPHDVITAVATDGDVIQEVRDSSGHLCGSVLWESKRTKKWQDAWLPKAREDQQKRGADMAVIVTVAMPKEVSTLGCKDGIWVANHHCFIGAAKLLRHGMMEVARSKRAGETKQTKSQQLHGYLHSTEFRQQVEGILEPVVAMKKALDTEKRSHGKAWKEQERQLEQAERNVSELYGSLDGILGGTLPGIALLECGNPTSDQTECHSANDIPAKSGVDLAKSA